MPVFKLALDRKCQKLINIQNMENAKSIWQQTFISASSWCCCSLIENALMHTEGVRCTQGTTKRARSAKVGNIFNCLTQTLIS